MAPPGQVSSRWRQSLVPRSRPKTRAWRRPSAPLSGQRLLSFGFPSGLAAALRGPRAVRRKNYLGMAEGKAEGRRPGEFLADGLVANRGAHEVKKEHEAGKSKPRLDDPADEGIEVQEPPNAQPAAQDAPTTSVPTRMATAARVETWSQLIFFVSAKMPVAPFESRD